MVSILIKVSILIEETICTSIKVTILVQVTVKCLSPHLNKTADYEDHGMYLLEAAIPVLGDHGCTVTATKDG